MPLLAFLVLLAGSCLVSFAVIYYTLVTNQSTNRPDYFRLRSEFFETEFPMSWFAVTWVNKNETTGSIGEAVIASTNLFAALALRVYDEGAARSYLAENRLTDPFSVVVFEANRLYNWSLQDNSNATLTFVENGTTSVSGYEAVFSRVLIKGGIKQEEAFYNLTSMFIVFRAQQRLAEIVSWGKEEDWRLAQETFKAILGLTKV